MLQFSYGAFQTDTVDAKRTNSVDRLGQILLEDISVPDLVGLDAFDGLSSPGHGEDLVDDGLDVLLDHEVKHLEDLGLSKEGKVNKNTEVAKKMITAYLASNVTD